MQRHGRNLIVGFPLSVAIFLIASSVGFVDRAGAELDTAPDPTWQVVTHIPDSVGLQTLVWDFAELNGVMYVGGSFADVRQGSGQALSRQAHLAAFDVDTGEWIPEFAPELDGAVFTIEAAPDGSHLVIGGEFTGGLRSIDPATGQTLPEWDTTVTHSATRAAVMDLEPDGSGGWYFGGNLTHVDDGNGPQRRFRLARIDGSGALDSTWQPLGQGGRVYTIAKSKVANWVHIGGKFTSMNVAEDSGFFATVSATNGDLIDSVPHGYPEGAVSSEGVLPQKIYGIDAASDKLWVGGEPHVLIALDPITLQTERWWYTNRGQGDAATGGDIQAVHVTEDRVYAGCHCWGSIDGFEPLAPDEWTDYRAFVSWFATEKHDSVRAVFAVDRGNMRHSPTFRPELSGQDGVWAITEDSNGRMWFGGEFSSAAGSYPGGFVRYSDAGVPTPRTVVEAGSNWRYRNTSSTPAAGWKNVGFDDGSWSSGAAELGFGDGNEVTAIDRNSWSRSAYFRHEFEVINAASAEHLAIEVTADDGYVAYVNGVEVGRTRMPAGVPTASTLATEAVWGEAERRADRVLVPTSLLQDGINVVAVEVHNASSGGDLSFDAELQAAGPSDLVPPKPEGPKRPGPNLLVSDFTSGQRILLRFNDPDTPEIANYAVYRNGEQVKITSNSSFADEVDNIGETYTYTVSSIGFDGRESAMSDPVVVTAGSRDYLSRRWARTIASGWRYTSSNPGDGWQLDNFDDGNWSQGTDRVGFGQGGLDTIIEPTDTLWLRSTVTIADAHAAPDALLLFVEADDAGVVYLNGNEIWRNNFADGPVTATSRPQDNLWTRVAERYKYSLISGDMLRPGENTFAMQINNTPGSTDLFASLGVMSLNYNPGEGPTEPTNPTVTGVDTSGVSLDWTAPTDGNSVASYSIYRNGQMVGATATNSFFDTAPAGTWEYTIKSVGPTGAVSTPTAVLTATVDPKEPPPDEWACTVDAKGTFVEVSWPDIGANGYDLVPVGGTVRWIRSTSYTHVSPVDSYTVIAWGNGVSGKTVTCDNPNVGDGGGWQCTVTTEGGSAVVSWPDIGANGYDVIRDSDPKKWVRTTSFTDPNPGANYKVVAWGNGVSGTATQCARP